MSSELFLHFHENFYIVKGLVVSFSSISITIALFKEQSMIFSFFYEDYCLPKEMAMRFSFISKMIGIYLRSERYLTLTY